MLELRIEHRALDVKISEMSLNPLCDRLELQRLKKQKLRLKDAITKLQDMLIPDLDA